MRLELKQGLRSAWRRPWATLAALLVVATGSGLATAASSIVYGSVLLPLPFPGGDRLYRVERVARDTGEAIAVRWEDVVRLRADRLPSLQGVVAWMGMGFAFGEPGEALRRENGALVTPELFPLVGVEPLLGRWFAPEEADRPLVVLSHQLWQRRFGGDPRVVGRRVVVWHEPAVVVGVMPPGFRFPLNQDLWMPLEWFATPGEREGWALQLLARLADRGSPALAAQQLAAALPAPADASQVALRVEPFVAAYTREARGPLASLWLGALGLLLVACLDTGQLLAVRLVRRTRELALRSALGADGRRRLGTILGEALPVIVGGVALGLPCAIGAVALYERYGGLVGSYWVDLRIHPPVAAFVALVLLTTAAAASAVPFLVVRRVQAADLLRHATASPGRALTRIAHLSVALQVCLTLAVVVAAALLGESLRRFAERELVRDPGSAVVAHYNLYGAGRDDPALRLGGFERLAARLRQDRRWAAVALADALPGGRSAPRQAELDGGAVAMVRSAVVSPGYFATLGHPLLQGRDFDARDGPSAPPVALVSASLVRRHFPDGALGRRLQLLDGGPAATWATVVGVVPDLFLDAEPLSERLGSAPQPGVYFPLAQRPPLGVHVIARARGTATGAAALAALEEALRAADADAVVSRSMVLADFLAGVVGRQRSLAALFGVLALASLLLSAAGIASLAGYTVEQRARELGVRRALGAPARHLLAVVLGGTAGRVAAGLAGGLALGWGVGRLLRGLLFDVGVAEPAVLAVACGVLLLAALAAAWLPARRALRTDPATALREA
ncbi:MAG TPA: ABC transporter permease [Thermoanaerobaculia bacterium]|nr:ABC transporter permease [Thermoanaerobaculia bacterium]